MKVVGLKICITDVTDALTLGQNTIVGSIINHAKELVAAGGIVTIERQYQNASPDRLISFTTPKEIEEWKNKLNDAQVVLGSEKNA